MNYFFNYALNAFALGSEPHACSVALCNLRRGHMLLGLGFEGFHQDRYSLRRTDLSVDPASVHSSYPLVMPCHCHSLAGGGGCSRHCASRIDHQGEDITHDLEASALFGYPLLSTANTVGRRDGWPIVLPADC